jgi:cell division septation protein DedD
MGRNPGAVASFALDGTKNLPKSQSTTSKPDSTATGVQTSGGQATAAGTSDKQPASAQSTAHADATAQMAGTASDSVSGVWQQVGFFKSRENADELVARLEKLGFKPVVRGDKRPSGTVYFAVLVPEDKGRTVAGRLKDSGFESYLVTDGQ